MTGWEQKQHKQGGGKGVVSTHRGQTPPLTPPTGLGPPDTGAAHLTREAPAPCLDTQTSQWPSPHQIPPVSGAEAGGCPITHTAPRPQCYGFPA